MGHRCPNHEPTPYEHEMLREKKVVFSRSAADIAQRLGPESWINCLKRQIMDLKNQVPSVQRKPTVAINSKNKKQHPARRSANPPARFAYHPTQTRPNKTTAARGQGPKQKHHQLPQIASKGQQTPQCINQKHAIETNQTGKTNQFRK